VNLHPADLVDDELAGPDSPLVACAHNIVLEVNERTPLDAVPELPRRLAELRERGFRIAIDDLGSGYAGLASLAALAPDVVKFDMRLVRGIERNVINQKLLRSMVALCEDLGIVPLAEGVETAAERDTLRGMGCSHMQGYFFAAPAREFATPLG
jgi:EAL domain-containing protein (putative c-di-GMP-specific phosphodiesterase class I)